MSQCRTAANSGTSLLPMNFTFEDVGQDGMTSTLGGPSAVQAPGTVRRRKTSHGSKVSSGGLDLILIVRPSECLVVAAMVA